MRSPHGDGDLLYSVPCPRAHPTQKRPTDMLRNSDSPGIGDPGPVHLTQKINHCCSRARTHTRTHVCTCHVHTKCICTHSHVCSHTHPCMCTHDAHANVRSHAHKHAHTCVTNTHVHTNACTHSCALTRVYIRVHACMHTHTHLHSAYTAIKCEPVNLPDLVSVLCASSLPPGQAGPRQATLSCSDGGTRGL